MNAEEEVREVLAQCVPDFSASEWSVKYAGAGGQATVFLAKRIEFRPPVQDAEELVVKIYDRRSAYASVAAQDEFLRLTRMEGLFRNWEHAGWKVGVPSPALLSTDPLALVMARVSGTEIDELLGDPSRSSAGILDTIIDPLLHAWVAYWEKYHQLIGDLYVKNILCDGAARRIYLIDPGAAGEGFECADVNDRFSPASRDLAYLLFETCATNVRLAFLARRRDSVRRRVDFVAALLTRYLEVFVRRDERGAFAVELRQCADRYTARISTSFSIPGVWRRFVVWKTLKTIDLVISSLVRRQALRPAGPPVMAEPRW